APWRADVAYLVSGAFGGIGARLTQAMVEDGARHLVLLARRPLPPRASWASLPVDTPHYEPVSLVRGLQPAGASPRLLYADVTDETAMREALATYSAEARPPIDGVLHLAGTLRNRFGDAMSAEEFQYVVAPKLHGAIILDRLLPDVSMFFFASSISSFWAPAGMSNYSAANAGGDALMAGRRARGRHGLSIRWC